MTDGIELSAAIDMTVLGNHLTPSFSVGLSDPEDMILDALKDAAMEAVNVGDAVIGGISSLM